MSDLDCPGDQLLAAFRQGRLPAGLAEKIQTHVRSCEACRQSMHGSSAVEPPGIAPPPPPPTGGAEPFSTLTSGADLPPETAPPVSTAPVPQGPAPAGDPARAPTESADAPQLGDYRLVAKLGEGGMGAVHKAVHTKLDKVVALKTLPVHRTTSDRAVARFEREMKAVGRLNHPNIVQALDAREIEGTHVLVMEFVDGLDLAELVRRVGPLPVPDACELVRQAAFGLQCAHENGLVHRDVKPSNLMLTAPVPPAGVPPGTGDPFSPGEGQSRSEAAQPTVKVLDLGLALLAGGPAPGDEVTGAGQVMGTADYIAPEQVTDSHAVDIRADVYSLGCTLYKLLTGRAPYSGPEYSGNFQKMTAHVNEPAPPIRGHRPDVPGALADALGRMLAKAPEDRFATPGEVAEAMAPLAAGSDLAAIWRSAVRAPGQPRRVEPPPVGTAGDLRDSALVDTRTGRSSASRRRRRRSAVRRIPAGVVAGTFAAIVAVLLLATVIYVVTDKGTLEIAALDPDVKVAVEQNGGVVTVIDTKTGTSVKLRTGDYRLTLPEGPQGASVEPDVVTVSRGQKVVARVRRRGPGAAAPPAAEQAPDVRHPPQETGPPAEPIGEPPALPPDEEPGETPTVPVAEGSFDQALQEALGSDPVEKALFKPIPFEFIQTPVQQVAEYMADVLGVQVMVDRRAMEAVGLRPDAPITCHFRDLPARTCLTLALGQLGLTWTVRDSMVWITTPEEAECQLLTRMYPVSDLVGPPQAGAGGTSPIESLSKAIVSIIYPAAWDLAGGPGSISVLQRAGEPTLVVSQTRDVHVELTVFLTRLRWLAKNPDILHQPCTAGELRVERALAELATLEFIETPLADVADFLQERHKINVLLDGRALEDVGLASDTPVTVNVKGVPLAGALRTMLGQLDLTWTERGGVLLVTTPEAAESVLRVRVYPVRDLVEGKNAPRGKQSAYDDLLDAITSTIAPASWADVAGTGSITPLSLDKIEVLVVSTTEGVHHEIADFLARMRP